MQPTTASVSEVEILSGISGISTIKDYFILDFLLDLMMKNL